MTRRNGNRNARVIVPRPNRVRRIGNRGFGWIDTRMNGDGWLGVLTPEDIAVYVFLCLVADRQGVSWYRRDRIRQALCIGEDEVFVALRRLCELDLVAYRPFNRHASEGFHQVLELPPGGPPSVIQQFGDYGLTGRVSNGSGTIL